MAEGLNEEECFDTEVVNGMMMKVVIDQKIIMKMV